MPPRRKSIGLKVPSRQSVSPAASNRTPRNSTSPVSTARTPQSSRRGTSRRAEEKALKASAARRRALYALGSPPSPVDGSPRLRSVSPHGVCC